MLILHVTNGDHAAHGLARSGLPGDVLAWRDVLHDGAVPPDDDREAFWHARAKFLTERSWTTEQAVIDDFAARDGRLDGIGADDAIVLWFEPDVYDQLQLIQVLSRLAQRPAGQRPRLSIAPADLLLGPLEPQQFLPLFDARREIVDEDLAHGRAAWRAFTSATPDALVALVAQFDRDITARSYAGDDATRLPHLAAAMRRMLEEYPDSTGLSRSERQICETLALGPTTLGKLYPASHHAEETWTWLGDTSFAWYVQRLSDCAQPLVSHADGSQVVAPSGEGDWKAFWQRRVTLTAFGAEVLHARADAVQANGIDRWIGGVHLMTARHWRWSMRLQSTVARP